MIAGAGDIQGRLHAGDAAADHQGVGIDRECAREERTLIRDPHQTGPDQDDRLCRGLILAFRHPGAVFPDTDHVEGPIGIQPRPLAGGPEGLFMHAGRAGGHHHMGEILILDFLLDEILSRIRAHKQIIFGNYDTREGGRVRRHLLHSDTIGNVDPAVADEKPDSLRHEAPPEKAPIKPQYDFFRFWQRLSDRSTDCRSSSAISRTFILFPTPSLAMDFVEHPDAVRTRRGDHLRTGPQGLFDPNFSEAFLADPVLPWPAAAAAATEAPLPVVLHFNQRHARYGCQNSPGRLIDARMPAKIAGIMVGHFEVNPVDGLDGTPC